jgi:hypothetical protein
MIEQDVIIMKKKTFILCFIFFLGPFFPPGSVSITMQIQNNAQKYLSVLRYQRLFVETQPCSKTGSGGRCMMVACLGSTPVSFIFLYTGCGR